MKRRPEGDAAGFYGDTFSNGFGDFETMKRARIPAGLTQVIKIYGNSSVVYLVETLTLVYFLLVKLSFH